MEWNTYHTNEIKEKYVYRYVTIEKLVDFLETNSLYLSRLDKFEDNLESIEPYDINELMLRSKTLCKPKDANSEIPEKFWNEKIKENLIALTKLQKSLDEKQKHSFVSCWILNDVESFAMWDIYGKAGFAIKFEVEYFQDLIKRSRKLQKTPTKSIDLLIAGTVQYQNFDDMMFNEKKSLIKYSAFRKHLAFKHETEYRIIGYMRDTSEIQGLKFILPKIGELKFNIIANPRLDSFQFQRYKSILSKYSKNHPLQESQLRKWLDFKRTKYHQISI